MDRLELLTKCLDGNVELADLAGDHILTGIERGYNPDPYNQYQNVECLRFTLDGITFEIEEDPDDGYRSSARNLVVSARPIASFDPVPVHCVHDAGKPNSYRNDIIEIYVGDKLLIRTGTCDVDDYYPSWVSEWNPENLPVNQEV